MFPAEAASSWQLAATTARVTCPRTLAVSIVLANRVWEPQWGAMPHSGGIAPMTEAAAEFSARGLDLVEDLHDPLWSEPVGRS